jgi:hypothetical protein
MINQDAIDLYSRTSLEAKVVVLDSAPDLGTPRASDDLTDHLERIFPGVHRGTLW